MDEVAFARYIQDTFSNVEVSESFGYQFFFYGDDHRMPFATLIASDNEYDKVSNLDRPEAFRLNIGVGKQTFQSLFGADEVSIADYDLTVLDRVMPHPDYARQFFVCILSPSDANLPAVQEMLKEAHSIAESRYMKRMETSSMG